MLAASPGAGPGDLMQLSFHEARQRLVERFEREYLMVKAVNRQFVDEDPEGALEQYEPGAGLKAVVGMLGPDGERGTIEEVLPRRTTVVRCQPRTANKVQVMAANVIAVSVFI